MHSLFIILYLMNNEKASHPSESAFSFGLSCEFNCESIFLSIYYKIKKKLPTSCILAQCEPSRDSLDKSNQRNIAAKRVILKSLQLIPGDRYISLLATAQRFPSASVGLPLLCCAFVLSLMLAVCLKNMLPLLIYQWSCSSNRCNSTGMRHSTKTKQDMHIGLRLFVHYISVFMASSHRSEDWLEIEY